MISVRSETPLPRRFSLGSSGWASGRVSGAQPSGIADPGARGGEALFWGRESRSSTLGSAAHAGAWPGAGCDCATVANAPDAPPRVPSVRRPDGSLPRCTRLVSRDRLAARRSGTRSWHGGHLRGSHCRRQFPTLLLSALPHQRVGIRRHVAHEGLGVDQKRIGSAQERKPNLGVGIIR